MRIITLDTEVADLDLGQRIITRTTADGQTVTKEWWAMPHLLTMTVCCTRDQDGEQIAWVLPDDVDRVKTQTRPGDVRVKSAATLDLYLLAADRVVGFNLPFDLGVLDGAFGRPQGWTASILAGHQVDILETFRRRAGHRVRLQQIAEALGLSKSGTGADAPRQWADELYREVVRYCVQDVEVTWQIYQYGTEHKRLSFVSYGRVRSCSIPTWLVQ